VRIAQVSVEQDTSGFGVGRASEGIPVYSSSFSDEVLRDPERGRWLPSTACVEPALGEADLVLEQRSAPCKRCTRSNAGLDHATTGYQAPNNVKTFNRCFKEVCMYDK